MNNQVLPGDYKDTLDSIVNKIKMAQQNAALSANYYLLKLYWDIGNIIVDKKNREDWGTGVIERLSIDLKNTFPDIQGFSARNLRNMRQLVENYPDEKIVETTLSQITWSHNLVLMNKVKNIEERKWYINKCVENGWARSVLIHQIEYGLYERATTEEKTHNFPKTLPPVQSELATQTLKDPYLFDFLTLAQDYKEKDLEDQLVKHITQFLLELGAGFAFVGRQYHLEVGGEDYYIDLLFYHLKLKSYIVVELKTVEFQPEFAGKLNFYLSAVDDILKTENDNPSIGILLCKEKNKVKAEYSLKDINKPIGISEYELIKSIPEDLKPNLPTIEEIEREIEDKMSDK